MNPLDSLPTPCLILDERRMLQNIARLRARLGELGVGLRPHLKTAKSVEVASCRGGSFRSWPLSLSGYFAG